MDIAGRDAKPRLYLKSANGGFIEAYIIPVVINVIDC